MCIRDRATAQEFIDDYHHVVEDTGIVLGEGVEGIILGKALYTGQLNFKEVCSILREE